jgi:hypothetical protein
MAVCPMRHICRVDSHAVHCTGNQCSIYMYSCSGIGVDTGGELHTVDGITMVDVSPGRRASIGIPNTSCRVERT